MTRAVRRWAVVLAAGRGERFGSGTPKQYRHLLGRPIIEWSLDAMLAERHFAAVVVAVAPGDRRWGRLACSALPRVESCVGGGRRDESLARALEFLAARAAEDDWVVVHDAARPCLRSGDLRRLLRDTQRDPVGGLLAVPVSDTLKRGDAAERASATVDRSALWRALTPQAFRFGLLRRALSLCRERRRPVTDEAGAIEALGLRPKLVRGHADNIKITVAEDLALAAAVLQSRRRKR